MENTETGAIYKFIIGSSQYTKEEIKPLLMGVIYEAEELGIPTLTMNELEKMKI